MENICSCSTNTTCECEPEQSTKDRILSETSEEVKQRVRDTANKLVMKQETIEEALDTPEEETLVKIKLVLLAGNDAQAIRLLEQYGGFMQERSYSEEEVLEILKLRLKWFGILLDEFEDNKWFEQFKKK